MAKKIKISSNDVEIKECKNIWKIVSIIFIIIFLISSVVLLSLYISEKNKYKKSKEEVESLKRNIKSIVGNSSISNVKMKVSMVDERLYFTRLNQNPNEVYRYDCIIKLDDGYYDKVYKDFQIDYSGQKFVKKTCN